MRKQIAAANWKMNLTIQKAEELLKQLSEANISLSDHQQVILAVPSPYLVLAQNSIKGNKGYFISAQNCYTKPSGAYTGEVSVEMLKSIGIKYCIIGHSERREYFNESNEMLTEKVNLCLDYHITPIFCFGEPLPIREENNQNEFVRKQLQSALFHLTGEQLKDVILAYEPIWAIGTGKTATTQQAQEMHSFIRSVIGAKYGTETAEAISILYGGSVKAENAAEIFSSPDVDGGLVGGASLVAQDFISIIKSLKK